MPPPSAILPELGEQRRRERVSRLAPQVDDAHRREATDEPAAELEPVQRGPALGPRRRAAEDRDRPLERGPLCRHRPSVVTRVGVLFVGLVVLLVDHDQPEPTHRREHRRARTDHHPCLPGGDPLALVAPLGLGQSRVEQRDPLAEAGLEPAERLRRQRDLGHEHDRAQSALERGRAGLKVDLGLAAAGRAVEQKAALARVHALDDPGQRGLLLGGQRGRRRLSGQSLGQRLTLAAPRPHPRRDELQRARRSRAVVLGQPERQVDERRRELVEDAPDRSCLHPERRRFLQPDDDAAHLRAPEGHRDDRPLPHFLRHLVGERREQPRERRRGDRRRRRPPPQPRCGLRPRRLRRRTRSRTRGTARRARTRRSASLRRAARSR